MVDWSPDKTKSCYKCENHLNKINFPEHRNRNLDLDCKLTASNLGLEEDTDTLIMIIEDVFENTDSDELDSELCLLANICPLYTPKEED